MVVKETSNQSDFPVPPGLADLEVGGLCLITAEMWPGLPPVTVSPGESSPYAVRGANWALHGEQSQVCSWQGRGWERELVNLSQDLQLLD